MRIRFDLKNNVPWNSRFVQEHERKNHEWEILCDRGTYLELYSDCQQSGYWSVAVDAIIQYDPVLLPKELFEI
jgi:hypothetical protein